MTECTCVYLHGFLSSQNSLKGQWFKQTLPSLFEQDNLDIKCRVITPDYPMSSPKSSVAYLQTVLKEADLLNRYPEQKWFIVGSSIGGFYAQYLAHLYNKPYLMINPALDPSSLILEYQGTHINPHTNEEIVINEHYRDALKAYYLEGYELPNQAFKTSDAPASLLLLDKGDEVIPYELAERIYKERSESNKTLVYEGGDHAFQHLEQSKLAIKQFIYESVILDSTRKE